MALVQTTAGLVRGREIDGVHSFLGVPFAGPLIGADRFSAPTPVRSWDGERDATEYGHTVPQGPYDWPTNELLPSVITDGPDALNVNVYTPDPQASGLPVLVWIHGGAFVRGSNSIVMYDGSAFARDGVVTVAINYRLGVLGFCSIAGAPENRGLLDQIAALEWVRDNIAEFGGDRANVTIFGESAGAMSVSALVASPLTDGLFTRAIMQSGNATAVASIADARLVTAEFCEKVSLAPTLASIAQLSQEDIQRGQDEISATIALDPDPQRWGASVISGGGGMMPLIPTIDGHVLPAAPFDAIRDGAGSGVEVLIGATRDEMRFFLVPNGLAGAVTDEGLPQALEAMGIPASAAAVYAAHDSGAAAGDILCSALSDKVFRANSTELADVLAARGQSSWMYEFAWPSAARDLRACHTLEIPFVFDTLAATAEMHQDAPQSLADEMHRVWVEFASGRGPGWNAVSTTRRPVRMFGDPALSADAVVDSPRADELAAITR